jgi:hypothetical protein
MRRFVVPLLAAFTAGLGAAEPVLRDSPFLPAGGAAAPAPAAPEAHEFTGVIVSGANVLVNLTDTQAKRSVWIAVGRTDEGIEVLEYDRKADAVSIRLKGGDIKRLALRQPSVAAASGATVATVAVAPMVPLPPPSSPQQAEREARMLVSDLLEIGMQQRKAYEEAQRKAALEAARRAGRTSPEAAAPRP